MYTNGYGGRKLSKSIAVFTNDPKHPQLKLKIAGEVEKFATISPSRVRLDGAADKEIKAEVTIVPEEKYPFKIIETNTLKGENISIKLEETQKDDKPQYLLTITNMKKERGRYFDKVNLKTNSTIQPEITINVYGNIM